MGRETAEEIRTQHRRHHRAVAATRLAGNPSVAGFGERSVALVNPRDDLVAEVGVVPARPGRVEKLAAAERRPGIDPDQKSGRRFSRCKELVHQLGRVLAERRTVAPHVELSGEALDQVDRRVPALRLVVVPGRHIDPERSYMWIAKRVVLEGRALERMFLETAGEVDRPGQ